MKHLTLVSLCFTLWGCPSTVVRDAKVFEAEMVWFNQAATEQASHLESLIRKHCTCTARKFEDPECKKAARTALTAKVRSPWHKEMSLHNAGLSKKRPSETPPPIPKPETLCPE